MLRLSPDPMTAFGRRHGWRFRAQKPNVVFYGSDLEINLLQCQNECRAGARPEFQQGTTMRDRSGVLRPQFS